MVVRIGDTELRRVLILAIFIIDELDAIAFGTIARLEIGFWAPNIAARVGNLLHDGILGNRVGRRTFQQNKCNSSAGRGAPSDREILASWHDAIQPRLVDRIALWHVVSVLISSAVCV